MAIEDGQMERSPTRHVLDHGSRIFGHFVPYRGRPIEARPTLRNRLRLVAGALTGLTTETTFVQPPAEVKAPIEPSKSSKPPEQWTQSRDTRNAERRHFQ